MWKCWLKEYTTTASLLFSLKLIKEKLKVGVLEQNVQTISLLALLLLSTRHFIISILMINKKKNYKKSIIYFLVLIVCPRIVGLQMINSSLAVDKSWLLMIPIFFLLLFFFSFKWWLVGLFCCTSWSTGFELWNKFNKKKDTLLCNHVVWRVYEIWYKFITATI
jgi:hypothetical protein